MPAHFSNSCRTLVTCYWKPTWGGFTPRVIQHGPLKSHEDGWDASEPRKETLVTYPCLHAFAHVGMENLVLTSSHHQSGDHDLQGTQTEGEESKQEAPMGLTFQPAMLCSPPRPRSCLAAAPCHLGCRPPSSLPLQNMQGTGGCRSHCLTMVSSSP